MNPPIRVDLECLPKTRGGRAAKWQASCVVGGVSYEAVSRGGASCELARKLVTAGVADARLGVYSNALHSFDVRSFHRHATLTYTEGRATLLHHTTYIDPSEWVGKVIGDAI